MTMAHLLMEVSAMSACQARNFPGPLPFPPSLDCLPSPPQPKLLNQASGERGRVYQPHPKRKSKRYWLINQGEMCIDVSCRCQRSLTLVARKAQMVCA